MSFGSSDAEIDFTDYGRLKTLSSKSQSISFAGLDVVKNIYSLVIRRGCKFPRRFGIGKRNLHSRHDSALAWPKAPSRRAGFSGATTVLNALSLLIFPGAALAPGGIGTGSAGTRLAAVAGTSQGRSLSPSG